MLFDFQLIAIFLWCSGWTITLVFFGSFTFSTISFGPIEFLEQTWEILNRCKFVKAKELFFFNLFIIDTILTDGSFQQIEGIKKINLRTRVINAKLIMLLQTWFNIIQLIYLFNNLFIFFLKYSLQVLLVLLLLLFYQFFQLFKLLLNQLLVYFVSLFDPRFVALANS